MRGARTTECGVYVRCPGNVRKRVVVSLPRDTVGTLRHHVGDDARLYLDSEGTEELTNMSQLLREVRPASLMRHPRYSTGAVVFAKTDSVGVARGKEKTRKDTNTSSSARKRGCCGGGGGNGSIMKKLKRTPDRRTSR